GLGRRRTQMPPPARPSATIRRANLPTRRPLVGWKRGRLTFPAPRPVDASSRGSIATSAGTPLMVGQAIPLDVTDRGYEERAAHAPSPDRRPSRGGAHLGRRSRLVDPPDWARTLAWATEPATDEVDHDEHRRHDEREWPGRCQRRRWTQRLPERLL